MESKERAAPGWRQARWVFDPRALESQTRGHVCRAHVIDRPYRPTLARPTTSVALLVGFVRPVAHGETRDTLQT